MRMKTKLNLQRTLDGMEFTVKKKMFIDVDSTILREWEMFLISWLCEHESIKIHSGVSGATWKSYLKRFAKFQELPRCSKKLWMTAKEKVCEKNHFPDKIYFFTSENQFCLGKKLMILFIKQFPCRVRAVMMFMHGIRYDKRVKQTN